MPVVRPIAFAILLTSLSAASAEPAYEAKAICRAALAMITALSWVITSWLGMSSTMSLVVTR